MNAARYIYWQDGDHWLGYFEEYPDYRTQGEGLKDLQVHLKDLSKTLPAVKSRASEELGNFLWSEAGRFDSSASRRLCTLLMNFCQAHSQ